MLRDARHRGRRAAVRGDLRARQRLRRRRHRGNELVRQRHYPIVGRRDRHRRRSSTSTTSRGDRACAERSRRSLQHLRRPAGVAEGVAAVLRAACSERRPRGMCRRSRSARSATSTSRIARPMQRAAHNRRARAQLGFAPAWTTWRDGLRAASSRGRRSRDGVCVGLPAAAAGRGEHAADPRGARRRHRRRHDAGAPRARDQPPAGVLRSAGERAQGVPAPEQAPHLLRVQGEGELLRPRGRRARGPRRGLVLPGSVARLRSHPRPLGLLPWACRCLLRG